MSLSITHSDVKRVLQLIGECRELGDDSRQWRSHLQEGVARLVDADLVMNAALTGVAEQQVVMHEGSAWGFQNGFNLNGWLKLVEEYGVDLRSEVTHTLLDLVRQCRGDGVTRTRQSVIPDRVWERSFDLQVIARTLGTEALLQSYFWATGNQGLVDSIVLGRGIGRREFDEYEESLVRLVHSEVASLIGGVLADFREPQPSQLPPRVRQVLHCILEGNTDKEIAQRLDLSSHTVNQYTKQVYRFFQVGGRNELQARWVRRGWKVNEHGWPAETAAVPY